MKTPRWTDKQRGRYRTSAESQQPGYLARRMKAYARLERMRAARQESNVTTIKTKAKIA